ncbi:MAG: Mov34/MPN/PAD-1 family protein [Phycisphaerales bacterium]|nr:Mov34/MPN/PAD-1 family protein [Phycisphaerales bacterium]MCB9856310.1 Mov34/MPN/PAD-1 family protein [Phycisphaerales bacterium]MCB9863251.1 Mov34/MPN/PAD-1 family protein [Phycisphaerales bacterium]
MAEYAASAGPAECCGLVLREGIRPCQNVLPDDSARVAYQFSPADAIFVAENADAGTILAIYHSHPEGPADWSAIDERAAWFAGAPLYPKISRLIIGCRAGVPFEIAGYSFTETAWRPYWRSAILP